MGCSVILIPNALVPFKSKPLYSFQMLSSNIRHLTAFNSSRAIVASRALVSFCDDDIASRILSINESSFYNPSNCRCERNISILTSDIHNPQTGSSHQLQIKRNLLSVVDHTLEDFRKHVERKKLLVRDVDELRNFVDSSFSKSGIKNIFVGELRNVLLLIDTENHLSNIFPIVVEFFKDDYRSSVEQKTELLSLFIAQSIIHQSIALARSIWNLEDAKNYKSSSAYQKYYTFLYEQEYYEEIVRDFERDFSTKLEIKNFSFVVVVAALCKIGNESALNKLSELMCSHEVSRDRREMGTGNEKSGSDDSLDKISESTPISKGGFHERETRTVCMYAWLALKLENYGLAYDIMNKCSMNTSLTQNMLLSIFTESGRLNDALLCLRTSLKDRARLDSLRSNDNDVRNMKDTNVNTFRINFETMKKLTDKVKNEGNENLTNEFVLLCRDLDESAHILDGSLEDMVFRINEDKYDASRKKRHRKHSKYMKS